MENTTQPLFLGCSPRKQGNSSTALGLLADIFPRAKTFHVCSEHILPCIACGVCEQFAQSTGEKELFPSFLQKNNQESGSSTSYEKKIALGCPLTKKDESTALLQAMYEAPFLFIVSPIYFYHLPSQAKALFDRMQPFWELQLAGRLSARAKKRCYSIFISGRPRGEKLFEGSLLSIKYAVSSLGYELEEPLLLRGYDTKNDLRHDSDALSAIKKYALAAQEHESQ